MGIEGIGNIGVLGSQAYLPALTTQGTLLNPVLTSKETARKTGSAFGDMLQQAVAGAAVRDAEHKELTTDLVLGEDVDLHTIPIAAQKAELMLNLTVQMRNKMIEAYQEIARMQI